jgi:hypothetical protein
MTELQVYLWLKLDGIRNSLFFLSVIVSTGHYFIALMTFLESPPESHIILNKLILGLCLFLIVLAIAIPSTKNYAVIKVLPKVVNSEAVQKDIPELYDLAIKYLKKELK